MTNLIDRTLSVGLLHAAASEAMIRRAMQMHKAQGMRLRHEAKRALTDFNEAYKRFARAYDRLQELATDKNIDPDTEQLFDAFLNVPLCSKKQCTLPSIFIILVQIDL